MRKLLIFLFCIVLLSVNVFAADNYVLRGQVLDERGQVFSYVSVGVIGLNRGGMTNEEGKFNIAVPENKQYNIRISMIGYSKIEYYISPGQYKIYNLEVDPFLMDEVVVVGHKEPEESVKQPEKTPEPDIMMQPFFFPATPYTAQSRAGATGTSGRTFGTSGFKPWEEDKDVKNIGNVCDKGCNKDPACETDNPSKDNPLYNNPKLESVCWDALGFHQDYCKDETHVVEFGCGGATDGTGSVIKNFFLNPLGFMTGKAISNSGTCAQIVKECGEGTFCDNNEGKCRKINVEELINNKELLREYWSQKTGLSKDLVSVDFKIEKDYSGMGRARYDTEQKILYVKNSVTEDELLHELTHHAYGYV